jgi:hypothetical protein
MFFLFAGLNLDGKVFRIYFQIGIIDMNTFSFSYFLLDQKVTKNQGFIKILAFLIRRYLPAIQGM